MKTLTTPAFAMAFLMVVSSATFAQTAPDQEKGSTGWGGGSKDQPTQQQSQTPEQKAAEDAKDVQAAKAMPEMASGSDLKGPSEQFAPRKTPE